jgi:hypothetical protein
MNANDIFIASYTLVSAALQVYGICRTAQFRMWETAPGSLLFGYDMPSGWRKVRGPVYIGSGVVLQLAGSIATLLM